MSPRSTTRPARIWSLVRMSIVLLLLLGTASAQALPFAQASPNAAASLTPIESAGRVSPLAYRTDLQPLRAPDGHPLVPLGDVLGAKRVMVLRVFFNDYAGHTPIARYSTTQVQGFFSELDKLWGDTSYGKISIDSQVSELFKLPDNRSAY